jgi:hypothetical protein
VQKLLKWQQYRYEMRKWKGTKMKNNALRENRENKNEKKKKKLTGHQAWKR